MESNCNARSRKTLRNLQQGHKDRVNSGIFLSLLQSIKRIEAADATSVL